MSKTIKLKRGLDIPLLGESAKVWGDIPLPDRFAVKPSDFPGIKPKLLVKTGDRVKAGTPLFFDKGNEKAMFCSPVSGEVVDIVRGEKRKLLEIVIHADSRIEYEEFDTKGYENKSREEIIEIMLRSGVWPFLRQRPWNIIARPQTKPRSIFISGWDSAPLAPDYNFIFKGQEELFQTGLNILKKLTEGKIYLTVNGKGDVPDAFARAQGVELNKIIGPHPAGNVGIQIHHIEPLNNRDIIWVINPQDVLIIGKLFTEGRFEARRVFNLCGSEVINGKYFQTLIGACVENYVKDNLKEGNVRIISGNVLTGTKITSHGFLGFYDQQVTVIPEGDYYEFMGWLAPGLNKYSTSGTFLSRWLYRNKKWRIDTNLHGGQRALMLSGEYDKVLPMDILPLHLIKAIIIEDIDLMEKLGIYEVVPEDFALCEFVCTSKMDLQDIVQKGIDLMIKELS